MTKNVIKTNCRACGKPVEIVDLTGIMYTDFCEHCGYESDTDYFEENGKPVLMSRKEASKKGLVFACPYCGLDMSKEEKKVGKCIVCQASE